MTPMAGPVHVVGVGGIHMSAIAQLLIERGIEVSGCDLAESPLTRRLQDMGATIYRGHDPSHVEGVATVVTTAAVADDSPELQRARELGLEVVIRADMVARLMEGKKVVAIAGSHGKSTTSGLVAHILRHAGMDPMFLLGAEIPDLGGHCAWGSGEWCVVEADEYKRAFHAYTPTIGLITNVEPDHLDYYGTGAAYYEAFNVFASRIVDGGHLFIGGNDPGAMAVRTPANVHRQTFGHGDEHDWSARNVKFSQAGTAFTLWHGNAPLGPLVSTLTGDHYVADIAGAAGVCGVIGVPFEQVAGAVASYQGASRRLQQLGDASGVTVVDTYAHHPTEVRADLAAARARFGDRRLIVLFQPHTYSRTSYLWNDWLGCWGDADDLILVETYAARETPDRGAGARQLAEALGVPFAADFDEAVRLAAETAKAGDVVITMGAGDVTQVAPRILEALS